VPDCPTRRGVGRQGIRVNAVCPGTIEIPMVDRMVAAGELDRNASAANSAIPRLGRADEMLGRLERTVQGREAWREGRVGGTPSSSGVRHAARESCVP
jgi:NAD(P)-dependent dehydrogenase (short-subunit alcohol dehydrogenase family)